MTNPLGSFSDLLLYNTVRIEAQAPTGQSVGTGSFFNMPVPDLPGANVEMLVTNKHVIANATHVQFMMHEADGPAQGAMPTGRSFVVEVPSPQARFFAHPDSGIDLCAVPTAPLIAASGHNAFRSALDRSTIVTDLQELCPVEEVLVTGYPASLWDAEHNFPLIRRGTTASPPWTDWSLGGSKSGPFGVLDIACFGGSSGSPVVVANQGMYFRKGQGMIVGSRFHFLGILFGGPFRKTDGEIVVRDIPTATSVITQTPTMLHLAYYIKACEVLALAETMLLVLRAKGLLKT